MTPYQLFLDDSRDVPDQSWVLARTLKEASDIVKSQGWPQHISFDYFLMNQERGTDFAEWIKQRHLSGDKVPPDFEYSIHSSSITGGMKIQSLMFGVTSKPPLNFKSEWYLDRGWL